MRVIRLPGARSDDATTYLGQLDDCTQYRRLNGSGCWRVFLQRQMCSSVFVVLEVGLQNAPQGRFIEDDHVVQALPSQEVDKEPA